MVQDLGQAPAGLIESDVQGRQAAAFAAQGGQPTAEKWAVEDCP
jgi:hypothetical protein